MAADTHDLTSLPAILGELKELRTQLVENLKLVDDALQKLELVDAALPVLRALASGRLIGKSVDPYEYRGVKPYLAASRYMQASNIREIGLEELKQALLDRGVSLGDNPKRYTTVLQIAINRNNDQGRKTVTYDKELRRAYWKDSTKKSRCKMVSPYEPSTVIQDASDSLTHEI